MVIIQKKEMMDALTVQQDLIVPQKKLLSTVWKGTTPLVEPQRVLSAKWVIIAQVELVIFAVMVTMLTKLECLLVGESQLTSMRTQSLVQAVSLVVELTNTLME